MLNYNVKGTGLNISDEIRTYIEKRFAHAEKFLKDDSTAHVDVELEFQTTEDRQKYRAELTLSSEDQVYRAEALGDSLHESIDIATGELNTELNKNRKKQISRVRR